MNLNRFSVYSTLVLRLGLGFVFMWFGWSGLTHPALWTNLVPGWTSIIAPAEMLVRLHGTIELLGGFLLFAAIKPKIVAGFLFLVLIHTIVLLEPGAIMVRDVGLATGLLSLALAEHSAKEKKSL